MKEAETSLNRRRVLAGLAIGGTLAAASIAAKNLLTVRRSRDIRRSAASAQSGPVALATAEMSDWAAAAGTTFVAGSYYLRLSGVQPLPVVGARPAGLRRQPFIAEFELPSGQSMAGDLVYGISHPNFRAFEIFLSTAGSNAPSRMIALFN